MLELKESGTYFEKKMIIRSPCWSYDSQGANSHPYLAAHITFFDATVNVHMSHITTICDVDRGGHSSLKIYLSKRIVTY